MPHTSKRTRFALIGLGHIAQSQHLPNMTRAPHVDLRTLCDLRQDVLDTMQCKYDVPQAATDYRQVLADPEIDAVCIATKEDAQAMLTCEALAAGKHVYVEKPLATTVEECAPVVAAQRESGKFVVVGFNRRMAPAYLRAREIVRAKGGARIIHYRLSDNACEGGYRDGTRVIHEMCHVFDLLRYFADSEAESVYCLAARPDEEVYVVRMASGCVCTVIGTGYVTRDVPKEHMEIFTQEPGGVIVEEFVELRTYGYPDFDHVYRFAGHSHPDREFTHKYLFQIQGAQALHGIRRMAWELIHRHRTRPDDPSFHDNAELARYIPLMGTNPRWNYMVDKGWLACIDYLAECIVNNKPPVHTAGAEDGLQATRIVHAAIRSRESGKAVSLRCRNDA